MNEFDCLNTVVDRTIATLQDVKANGARRQYSFDINTEDFADCLPSNITLQGKFVDVFTELRTIKGPVLYWFEILSDVDKTELKKRFESYKKNENIGDKFRNMPAMRNHVDISSSILYVGKVRNNYKGRLIQHMGFFTNRDTQGLQLCHWTKGFPLKLKVHIMEFKEDMADMMGVLELEFARFMKPLIGKHK